MSLLFFRRFIALYTSTCIFPLDDELSEIVGHSYLFLKEQLEISALPPSPGILHGTIIGAISYHYDYDPYACNVQFVVSLLHSTGKVKCY